MLTESICQGTATLKPDMVPLLPAECILYKVKSYVTLDILGPLEMMDGRVRLHLVTARDWSILGMVWLSAHLT